MKVKNHSSHQWQFSQNCQYHKRELSIAKIVERDKQANSLKQ